MSIIIHETKLFARHPRFAYVEDTLREVERIWRGVLEDGVKRGVFRRELNLALVLRMILDLAGSAVEWYRPNSRRYSAGRCDRRAIGIHLPRHSRGLIDGSGFLPLTYLTLVR